MQQHISLIFGYSLMSLYSVSTKLINLNTFSQVLARCVILGLAGFIFGSFDILKLLSNSNLWYISIIQLIHIYSSYIGFTNLNAGMAMSLFYLYPIFGLLLSSKFNLGLLLRFFISLLGVIVMCFKSFSSSNNFIIGLIGILIASLTEAYGYVNIAKKNYDNPFDSLSMLYFGGLIILLGLLLFKYNKLLENFNKIEFGKSLLFNLIIGLVGSLIIYKSINIIKSESFFNMAYPSIITAYLFGWLLLNEKIIYTDLLGSILILTGVKLSQNFINNNL
jgi:drug/metabolite transporter (DMT)-like permease